MRLGEHTASCSAASYASPKKSLGLWLALSTLVGFNFGAAFKGILPNFYRWTQSDGFQIIHTNAILNDQISTPAQRSPHYYSPRPCWLPNDFTTMIFLHLVNLVTRTHETYETQLISFAAASRAVLPVYVLHRLTQARSSFGRWSSIFFTLSITIHPKCFSSKCCSRQRHCGQWPSRRL